MTPAQLRPPVRGGSAQQYLYPHLSEGHYRQQASAGKLQNIRADIFGDLAVYLRSIPHAVDAFKMHYGIRPGTEEFRNLSSGWGVARTQVRVLPLGAYARVAGITDEMWNQGTAFYKELLARLKRATSQKPVRVLDVGGLDGLHWASFIEELPPRLRNRLHVTVTSLAKPPNERKINELLKKYGAAQNYGNPIQHLKAYGIELVACRGYNLWRHPKVSSKRFDLAVMSAAGYGEQLETIENMVYLLRRGGEAFVGGLNPGVTQMIGQIDPGVRVGYRPITQGGWPEIHSFKKS